MESSVTGVASVTIMSQSIRQSRLCHKADSASVDKRTDVCCVSQRRDAGLLRPRCVSDAASGGLLRLLLRLAVGDAASHRVSDCDRIGAAALSDAERRSVVGCGETQRWLRWLKPDAATAVWISNREKWGIAAQARDPISAQTCCVGCGLCK
jgi:hypothetical protein